MLSVKNAPKIFFVKKLGKQFVSSLRQLLNGLMVQRIAGLQIFEVRFGSFCEETMTSEQLRKKMRSCCLQEIRSRRQEARFVDVKGR